MFIRGLHSLFDHSTTNPTQFIEEVEMLTRKMSVSSLNCFFINSQEWHVYFTVSFLLTGLHDIFISIVIISFIYLYTCVTKGLRE